MKRFGLTLAVVILAALMAAQAALASAGGYDCNFGDFGKTVGGSGQAKAIDIYDSGPQQGKILVTVYKNNDFEVFRLNADGSLDTSFGTGGFAPTVDFFGSWDYANGVAGLADGSVLVAGQGNNPAESNMNYLTVVRYTADGALDTSFGAGGKFVQKISAAGKNEYWNDAVADSSGNIYIAGQSIDGSSQPHSTVVKVTSAGTLGGAWTVDYDAGTYDEVFNAIVIQSDGKLVAGGSYYDSSLSKRIATVTRFTTAGAPDGTFSGDGKMTFSYSSIQDEVRDLALDGSGNILAAFDSAPASNTYDFAVARIASGGSLDTTFNSTGMTNPVHVNLNDFPYAVLSQADGKIVVGGGSNASSGAEAMTLLRFTSGGVLDSTFGNSGVLQIDTTGGSKVYGLAQQPSGKLLAVGSNSQGAVVASLHDLDFDMRYGATRLTQKSDVTFTGLTDQEIMHVEVCMDGLSNPISLTDLQFNTTGTTDDDDIGAAHLYTTANGTFATGTPFGSPVSHPSGAFTFTDSLLMQSGDNHFWLAYDVSPTANGSGTHVLDAALEELDFSGATGSVTPTATTAAGARPIYLADNSYFWITNVTLNTLANDSGADQGGYGEYITQTTTLNLGSSYVLSVTVNYSGYGGEAVSAFFDWNADGDFTDPGEDYPLMVSAVDTPPDYLSYTQTTTASVTVPISATLGSTSLMIMSDWAAPNGVNNQSGYGENEYYSLNLESHPTGITLVDFSGRAGEPGAWVPRAAAVLLAAVLLAAAWKSRT